MTETTADIAVAEPTLSTLSPSRASDFKTCPQLYKFKAIDKIETEPTVHQARGTTAHLALERTSVSLPRSEHPIVCTTCSARHGPS